MSADQGERRAAYRTLNEPTRLLGLSLGGWAAVIAAGGVAYGWLLVSPLAWRANVSLVAILVGGPLSLLLLREASALSPARLLLGALRWRLRPSRIVAPTDERPVRAGGVRLNRTPSVAVDGGGLVVELPWRDDGQTPRGAGA